ncbi:sugar-binding transcriptional regulator [Prauserella cavernicola]|uniref:DNA-binding transcriptional regulator n=1 Tax=Prauserella cavernicola TaxID=2800127 RepID=A0A934QQ06_9PSEU|nr:sugar-binding domain-containing protein [Prauserella cavernicola]MBK1783948.1 DNA-binding transcriptional regulator [Prauserella cavernicola]
MASAEHSRRDLRLMHQAAQLYYLDELGQARIAERLSVSRPTVSRLLADARRLGIVRITVHDPGAVAVAAHPERVAEVLGLKQVWLAPFGNGEIATLAEPVGSALRASGPTPGDVLLVSSGRTVYELSRSVLPALPGVNLVPMVGGVAEPEPWHQTNEIVRSLAERVGARPHFLFAQAMPSKAMRATLDEDPEFRRVTDLWQRATVALLGVGAPPTSRSSISTSIPMEAAGLQTAVGDICLNFFDQLGGEAVFPGSDRMVRISTDQLRAIPSTIAVAVGANKVGSIIAGARAGLFNRLVTDIHTAELILATV